MKVLVLNSGSSSLKYKLFDMTDESLLASGLVERIGITTNGGGALTHKVTGREPVKIEQVIPTHKEGPKMVLDIMVDPEKGVLASLDDITAVGHRVLHGKEAFADSVIVDNQILDTLKSFIDIGPLHMPANIMGIESCLTLMPGTPQVAVFDTAFHQTMPRKAFLYALPYELYEKYGVRRYGFHGTSHRYVSMRAAEIIGKPFDEIKMITLHLGNGSSAAAIKNGKVVDTTMGFTPLEGFVMGSRCGDIDPAIVPFVMSKLNLSPQEMDSYMNKKSGFLGMTGISSDMRDVQQAYEAGDPKAKDAYDVFIYRLLKYIGQYYIAMEGLDAIVFTAGIGENDDIVRRDVCKGLEFMGVRMDYSLNEGLRGKETILSKEDSSVKVLLVPTNEELMIAKDAFRLVG